MIGLLVWSYNRPAQLDFLLRSIERYCPNTFEINVIFKSSGGKFAEGYEKLESYHENVNFYYEENLAQDTKNILSKYDYCAVSTDDTVIYRSFTLPKREFCKTDVFSLRYGLNTIVQDPFNNTIQPSLIKYSIWTENDIYPDNTIIEWDSRLHHPLNNYGFLFGHDMHIYSRRYLELIQDFDFKKINELESWLYNNCRDKINPFIRSFKHSVAVNIPANNTSGVTQTDNSAPLEVINQKFLDGKRFRFEELEKAKIMGAHQRCDLVME